MNYAITKKREVIEIVNFDAYFSSENNKEYVRPMTQKEIIAYNKGKYTSKRKDYYCAKFLKKEFLAKVVE